MKLISVSTIFASVTFFKVASAHATVRGLWVNGVDQGEGIGRYIRSPPSNAPVKDLKSSAVACNLNGANAVSSFVTVPAGATIEPEWQHDNRGDDIIDGSHKGPIVAYLAPYESNGVGQVWVKISQENYDGTQWPVDKIKANKGRHSVKIPAGLAPGKYLFRTEILALHESDTLFSQDPARGIQLYPSCSQITITGSGKTTLPGGVSFPGAYKDSDSGIRFNLYGADPKSYVVPGPAVWDGVTGGSPAPTTAPPAPAPSSTATKPTTTVVSSKPAQSSPVTKPTTTPAQPPPAQPTPTKPTTPKNPNDCYNDYNRCIAAGQPNPNWTGCGATRDSCLSTATWNRAKRDGKFGRLLL